MKEKAIEIINLNYKYKSNWVIGKKPGIKDISLDIFEGEAFGFLGSNGAGKTTTIKLLMGLTFADSGDCKIFGKPSHLPESRREVGYISEQPYFYDNLKVIELVQFYAALKGLKGKEGKKKSLESLERVGLNEKIYSRLRGLSKGLTQRVALAQALLGNPRLLVLDEPLSGLDPVGRREFMNIFFEEHHKGTTIFMSSHILNDVESLCERVSIMKKGEIKAVFETKSASDVAAQEYEIVFTNTNTAFTDKLLLEAKASLQEDPSITYKNNRCYIKIKSKKAVDIALEIAKQNDCNLESLSPIRNSLENIFMEITSKQNN